MMKKRTVQIGDVSFLGPFSAGGFWVSDARGDSVAECRTQAVAKALADMLNAKQAQSDLGWEIERNRDLIDDALRRNIG